MVHICYSGHHFYPLRRDYLHKFDVDLFCKMAVVSANNFTNQTWIGNVEEKPEASFHELFRHDYTGCELVCDCLLKYQCTTKKN
jgi:hypothetical protein